MTRRRTARAKRREWTADHVVQLTTGRDFFGGGWGDGPHDDATIEDMRHAYRRLGGQVEELTRRQFGTAAKSWASINLFKESE